MPNRPRTVFFISDRTGLTAEAIGHSLLTQFPNVKFEHTTIPFVDTEKKAHKTVEKINEIALQTELKPIAFCSVIEEKIRHILGKSKALTLDIFETFLTPLERELKTHSSHTVGMAHAMKENHYKSRMDAVNFTLSSDDGLNTDHYDQAEVILVGVSRCGKTPTCLYLALQFSVFAANYPLTEEDLLEHKSLPESLLQHQSKLFGLTIAPQRLADIRQERRGKSRYASNEQCIKELKQAEILMKQANIPVLNTTNRSIEEIATKILDKMGLQRHTF